ncbi:MAG TPA: ANTAR domain-containing protein [Candidatus Methylomirabilis sp.]|nr:ANTAR domain-containing protein [Candidatus Methylomirabilis sp.]
MNVRVMVVDESPARAESLRQALLELGYRVIACIGPDEHIPTRVRETQPDVIIIDVDSPDRDTLEHLCVIDRDQPRPVVLFTHDDDRDKIRAAMRAGVSAYVVRGLSSERVQPVIEVAMARFQEFQALRRRLDQANASLAERKRIERAKGILMKSRGCAEDEAYRLLRKMAMDRGKRVADIADTLIAAEDLLAQG